MITNNHNNSLKENIETDLTFHVNVCPQLFVRSFDPYLRVGDRLLLRYYVTDWQDREYVHDAIAPTFTTIVRIDEDTVDQSEVVEFRQTTYGGEQFLDIGTFGAGIHSFSIRTIQSNGVGSGTQFFRFLVEPADAWVSVLDLNETLHFTASMDQSRYVPHLSDPYYDGGELKQEATVFTWLSRTVASYDVTVVKEGGEVKDIVISVIGTVTHENLTAGSARTWATEDISGEYHVATECQVNGTSVRLSDYLDNYDPNSPHPAAVVQAATKNKLALTRLFEAAKAHSGKSVLRMPKDMVIVTEYYKWSGSISSGGIVSGEGGSPIEFPDEFTLDLNGGTICTLINPYITGSAAVVVGLSNNFNTHIHNGHIRGCYTNFPLGNGVSTYEHFGVFGTGGCLFCSLRNVELSGSCGYDLNISKGSIEAVGANTAAVAPYMNYGYIGYDGEIHEPSAEELSYLDAHREALCLMYSDQRSDITTHASKYLHGYTNYFYRQDGAGGANRHREVGREMFVHYYDSEKRFIKTEKILQNYPILVPKGTVYVRTTLKGCNKSGTRNSLIQAIPTNSERKLGNVKFQRGAFNWCVGLYGCRVHDERSCLFDGDYCTQTIVKDCLFWNIAGERDKRYGGYSITKRFADLEDSTEYIFNMYLDNCELAYGDTGSFTIHRGNNVCLVNVRGIAPMFQKDVYGGQYDKSYGGIVKYNGYGTPISHTTITNSILRGLQNERYAYDHGAATGDIWLKYCTLFNKSGGMKDKIHGVHCLIPNT